MRLFNAFQVVCLFVAMPYIIQWLDSAAEFYGAKALGWAACAAYVGMFGFMVWVVWDSFCDWYGKK